MQATSADPDFDAVIVTTSPAACPGTEKVGVLSLVMLSVEDPPESDAGARSGVKPAAAVASIVNGNALEATETFPAGSVSVAETFQFPSVSAGNTQFDSTPIT